MNFAKKLTVMLLFALALFIPGIAREDDRLSAPGFHSGEFGENGHVYRETHSGSVLHFFSLDSRKARGWAIDYATGQGWDIFGLLDLDGRFRWSSQGAARLREGLDANFRTDSPYTTYTWANSLGDSGTGVLSIPSHPFQGSFYESFFDGSADGWVTNTASTWSIVKTSGPGDNTHDRVYSFTSTGRADASPGWAGPVSLYKRSLPSSGRFVLRADVRKLAGDQDSAGLVFCADAPSAINAYLFMIGPDACSLIKCAGGSSEVLLRSILSPGIRAGSQWNALEVEKFGSVIRLFVNGIPVDTYDDSTPLTGGMVGVAGTSPAVGATFQWDNVTCHRNTGRIARSEADVPERPPERPRHTAAPGSDLDSRVPSTVAFARNGEIYIERAGGLFLEHFVIEDGTATGWTISYMIDKGWDNFGSLDHDGRFRWSTTGRCRLQYGSEYDYVSPYPWNTYGYIDGTGYDCRGGTIAVPEGPFRGSVYESFSDGIAGGWLVDDPANWSIENRIGAANRIYVAGRSNEQQRKVSLYDHHYTTETGFTCAVDALSETGTEPESGLIFCARGVGAVDCYSFSIERERFRLSKWIESERTILLEERSPLIRLTDGERHAWNSLKVVMIEESIDLFINDRWVGDCLDATHEGGRNGIFGDAGTGVNRFDNFTCHRKTFKSTRPVR